jgi:hypothetical protein
VNPLAAGIAAALAALPGPAAQDPPAQEPPAPEPRIAWAVGDGADGSDLARGVARLIRRDEPDRLLYLGDVYNRGSAAEFERNFRGVYGDLTAITAPTIGNHEWALRRQGYYPFWRGVRGRRMRPWYRFELGGWELFSLNSEADHDSRSRQLSWLRRRLRDAEGDCRLAFWHRPRFSAGSAYGDDAGLRPFWRVLRGRARLALSGHEHNMQRLRPRGGIVQLVSGAGGTTLYPVVDQPRLRFGRGDRRGALRLELSPGRARLEFRGVGGRVLDRSRVSCSPAS